MTIYQVLYEVSTVVELCSRKIWVNLLITLFSKNNRDWLLLMSPSERTGAIVSHGDIRNYLSSYYFLRKCHCVNRPLFSDIIIIYCIY